MQLRTLASHQALRKGEGEGKESLVATVCACADFLATNHHARAMLVIKRYGIIKTVNTNKHCFYHEGLSFVVNSNRSVLILSNTTAMKKQWVTILEQLLKSCLLTLASFLTFV